MKIINFIEDLPLIEKILRHLTLWDIRDHDSPEPEPEHIPELAYDYLESQIRVVDYWS